MTELLGKFQKIAESIAADRGRMKLFGIFLREDSPDYWDVIIAAKWLDDSGISGLRYVSKQISKVLETEEMLDLARIVPMQTTDEAVLQLSEWVAGRQLPAALSDFDFSGTRIKTAYVLSAYGSNVASMTVP
jgi:hypothetical protein